MVYYYTSGNVKMLRNIINDYGATYDVSPYEYMKTYIEQCPETTEDAKICWIAESFISIQKHQKFLQGIASSMSEELSYEDQDYFMIVFNAVTFQIEPKNMQYLYKCIFNISKPLLNTFTKFLSNNEVLTFISQVAQSSYDTNYITEKIVGPLFAWQPYISEMAHSYAEYVKKVASRKLKPPTIPVRPNVLKRSGKDSHSPPQTSIPLTPPNSLLHKAARKMLTKSAIDQKLKHIHEINKQKAAHLLNSVKTKDYHFAQVKSEKYYKKLSHMRNEIENDFEKPIPKQRQKFVIKNAPPPVKETAATLKRMNKRIQQTEQEEVQWLQNLIKCCKNTTKVEELEQYDRQERERERLLDIEKKHLMGQITYEESLIAKKKLLEDNKKKYEAFLKEKEVWNEEIEHWKKFEMEKNRKQVEKLSMIELNLLRAKNDVALKKKEIAEKLKKESELILARALKEKQEELEHRISMIKEIKILAMIARNAKVPKIIDLTETAGLGLLCEMSMAELQERLSAIKIGLKDELENKKKLIRDENEAAKRDLEEAKNKIQFFMSERAILRKQNKKTNITLDGSSTKEINDLKMILDQKRRLRLKLTTLTTN